MYHESRRLPTYVHKTTVFRPATECARADTESTTTGSQNMTQRVSTLIAVIVATTAGIAAAGGPLYVNANLNSGTDTGLSWEDAFQGSDGLRRAIAVATAGTEIWVAQGVYKPTTTTNRFSAFELKNNVQIYGGFDGTESSLQQRDIAGNETILSGDLNGNDLGGGGFTENSYQVVDGNQTNASARLDGFTITGGNANHPNIMTDQVGGGIVFLDGSNPTIANCRVTGNRATFGGGACYMRASSPLMINCMFDNNIGGNFGGAFDCFNQSSPTLNDCQFLNNTAFRAGGVEFFGNCNPTLNRCLFKDNTAAGGGAIGGAMYIAQGGVARLNDCVFENNSARNGGGIYNELASPRITRAIFDGNFTTGTGGQGGAMYNINASPQIVDSLFVNNMARLGGAIRNLTNSNAQLTNVTIVNNEATGTGTGGGLSNAGGSPTVRSSILWNNSDNNGTGTGAQISDTGSSNSNVRYSDVQGGWTGTGVNNINEDPQFVDAANGNYRFSGMSPCADAGDPFFNPAAGATDLDGQQRELCSGIDMGAYESGDGDPDCDGVVDLLDIDAFNMCVTGPDNGPVTNGCLMFDFDGDDDIDFADASGLWTVVTE